MRKILNLIDKSTNYFLQVILIFVTLLLFINVIGRYVFHHSIYWYQEITELIFLWLVMVGAALLQKEDGHVKITYLYDVLTPNFKKILDIFRHIITLIILTISIYYSLDVLQRQVSSFTPALRLSRSIFALGVTLGLILQLIYTIVLLINRSKENKKNSKNTD